MRRVFEAELGAIFAALPTAPRCVVSGNFATPSTLLHLFDRHVPVYRLHMLHAQRGIPDRPGVVYETAFVGPGMRGHPRLEYVPCRLSLVPRLLAGPLSPDIVLIHTTPPRDGVVSLGIETNVLPAAIESAKRNGGIVVAQSNPSMPYTFGDSEIEEQSIDYHIEVDEPLPTPVVRTPTDVEHRVGTIVAGEVTDGATLQVGIGAIPNAVLAALVDKRGLSVYSEVFSDGVMDLVRAGATDDSLPIRASFLFGTQELYEWVNGNPRVRILRTETSNSPARIAEQRLMTSINAALQIDLYDQANAARIGGRIYSGLGGSTDFLVGAMHASGGRSLITLRSWHDGSDSSTIVPKLDEPTTHLQHGAIITEHGVARVFGRSQRDQALSIINDTAHPRARDWLMSEAGRLGLA